MKKIRSLMQGILQEWTNAQLLKRIQYGPSKDPCISFKVYRDTYDIVWVQIIARHGRYGELYRTSSRMYFSTSEINEYELINQLFNTLTFEGSPYYWGKTRFNKRVES